VSIEQFIYTWKAASYDLIECVSRDDDGNPTYIRFSEKDKLILEIFIEYDADGNWLYLRSKKPIKKKPTKKVYK